MACPTEDDLPWTKVWCLVREPSALDRLAGFDERDVETGLRFRLLGHRQTKGAETDKQNLTLPRHISTLPQAVVQVNLR
jgi:hypothetical protein